MKSGGHPSAASPCDLLPPEQVSRRRGASQCAVTQTWILKATRLGFYAATVADCPSIIHQHRRSLQYVNHERVEVVTLRVENTRRIGAARSFGV